MKKIMLQISLAMMVVVGGCGSTKIVDDVYSFDIERNSNSKKVVASGKNVSGTIKAQSVTEIKAAVNYIVKYTVGSPVSVTYTVPQSIEPYLDITCNNGTLTCGLKSGVSIELGNRNIVVNVVAPAVNEFEADSNASITGSGKLNVAKLEVDAKSNGSITLSNVNANSAEIEGSSNGTVNIGSLVANNVEVEATSNAIVTISGNIKNAHVEVSTNSIATLTGKCDNLNAEATTNGEINATKASIGGGSLSATTNAAINVRQAINTPFITETSTSGSINIR